MFEYALEQVPMDIQKLQRGERERLLIQQLGNIGSYSISLFLFCIVFHDMDQLKLAIQQLIEEQGGRL